MEDKHVYIEGLKKFQEKGVRIYVEEKEANDRELEAIVTVNEDGSFYMGDYIIEEEKIGNVETRVLKEIRFNKICNRQ